jgi:hypothetical protein
MSNVDEIWRKNYQFQNANFNSNSSLNILSHETNLKASQIQNLDFFS